jgi:hypothetical protein
VEAELAERVTSGAAAGLRYITRLTLTADTIPDIPTSVPEPIPTYETWLLGMQRPEIYPQRVFAAWVGTELTRSPDDVDEP